MDQRDKAAQQQQGSSNEQRFKNGVPAQMAADEKAGWDSDAGRDGHQADDSESASWRWVSEMSSPDPTSGQH
jgi:hypothetical protein